MKVVGVSFRHQCKMYWFSANDENILRGQHVIVETEQGMAYADVTVPTTEMADEDLPEVVKPILRVATKDDDDQQKLNEKNEEEAVVICKQKVKEHEKEMKIIRAMYAFDRSKLTFYFTAEGRVDFVALVKDLAHEFRTRIELRQVGVRDETRLLGGIGVCGRELCCATWLTNFAQVPIKAAKEQNLSLNTAKISGFCGRLMCCLKNEEDTYRYLNSKLPDINQRVKTKTGEKGIVKSTNILRQKVSVLFGEGEEEKELREYEVADLIFEPSKKKQYIPEDAENCSDDGDENKCATCGKCAEQNNAAQVKSFEQEPKAFTNAHQDNNVEQEHIASVAAPKEQKATGFEMAPQNQHATGPAPETQNQNAILTEEPKVHPTVDLQNEISEQVIRTSENETREVVSNGDHQEHHKKHHNRYANKNNKFNQDTEKKPDLEELIAAEEEKEEHKEFHQNKKHFNKPKRFSKENSEGNQVEGDKPNSESGNDQGTKQGNNNKKKFWKNKKNYWRNKNKKNNGGENKEQ